MQDPIPHGTNPELDALYTKLGIIEEREIHAIEYARHDLLPPIRTEQLPIKRQINAAEGKIIYPEAAIEPVTMPHPGPFDASHESMPDGSTFRFTTPIRVF